MVQLRIALRYLFSRKRHNAVNIISRISVAGMAVATAAIICILSVFNGFSAISENRLEKISPDLRVEPASGKTIANADSLTAQLCMLSFVKAGAPVVQERMLAIYAGRQLPVVVKGVPEGYDDISNINDIIIDGDYELAADEQNRRGSILSVGAAISLSARPALLEPLLIYAPKRVGRINPASAMSSFRVDTLSVAGVYETKQSDYDSDRIIIPLDIARNLLDYSSEATAVELAVKSGVNAGKAARELQRQLGPEFEVKDRLQQQEHAFRMIAVEKWITFAMLAFVMIIASFNVISTLSMMIIEKRDSIATLRNLGADNRSIGGIFAWESWLISLLGGISGTILGLGLCYAQQWGGFIKLNGDPSKLSVSVYPVLVDWLDIGAVFALVCVVGLLIALISSSFAKKFTR